MGWTEQSCLRMVMTARTVSGFLVARAYLRRTNYSFRIEERWGEERQREKEEEKAKMKRNEHEESK